MIATISLSSSASIIAVYVVKVNLPHMGLGLLPLMVCFFSTHHFYYTLFFFYLFFSVTHITAPQASVASLDFMPFCIWNYWLLFRKQSLYIPQSLAFLPMLEGSFLSNWGTYLNWTNHSRYKTTTCVSVWFNINDASVFVAISYARVLHLNS